MVRWGGRFIPVNCGRRAFPCRSNYMHPIPNVTLDPQWGNLGKQNGSMPTIYLHSSWQCQCGYAQGLKIYNGLNYLEIKIYVKYVEYDRIVDFSFQVRLYTISQFLICDFQRFIFNI